jgi:hypothetical protein
MKKFKNSNFFVKNLCFPSADRENGEGFRKIATWLRRSTMVAKREKYLQDDAYAK